MSQVFLDMLIGALGVADENGKTLLDYVVEPLPDGLSQFRYSSRSADEYACVTRSSSGIFIGLTFTVRHLNHT